MSSVQVYSVSQLAEQTTPVATLLSDSFGLVENMSFLDLDQMAGWEMPEQTEVFRRENLWNIPWNFLRYKWKNMLHYHLCK
jgi:hypothetical protein